MYQIITRLVLPAAFAAVALKNSAAQVTVSAGRPLDLPSAASLAAAAVTVAAIAAVCYYVLAVSSGTLRPRT